MTMPIYFIDTETTGLHQDKQLWEVAIIRRDYEPLANALTAVGGTGYRETRYESFVKVDISNADVFGLNVGRFYERHPLGRMVSDPKLTPESSYELWLPDEQDVVTEIARFTHGARFIGAVPSFDAEVLSRFMRECGGLPTWHYHLIDVCELAIGYLIGRGEHRPEFFYDENGAKMDTLADMLEIEGPGEKRHEAMADAEFAMRIWDKVME